MSFDYGQKQLIELKSARKVKNSISPEAEHKIVKIDLKTFGNSAITDNIDVPKKSIRKRKFLSKNTYNIRFLQEITIFLSYALAYAEVLQANDIFIGANILDYSGYPDCRPAYIEAFNIMANLATSRAVGGEKIKIHAPLIQLNKAQNY